VVGSVKDQKEREKCRICSNGTALVLSTVRAGGVRPSRTPTRAQGRWERVSGSKAQSGRKKKGRTTSSNSTWCRAARSLKSAHRSKGAPARRLAQRQWTASDHQIRTLEEHLALQPDRQRRHPSADRRAGGSREGREGLRRTRPRKGGRGRHEHDGVSDGDSDGQVRRGWRETDTGRPLIGSGYILAAAIWTDDTFCLAPRALESAGAKTTKDQADIPKYKYIRLLSNILFPK